MRTVNKIIIHCSASDRIEDDDISVIAEWHYLNTWLDVGYHFFITKAGVLQYGRPIWMSGSHCELQNSSSIGICLSGNEHFSDRQFFNCKQLLSQIYANFNLTHNNVYPHNHFDKSKTCPNFDIRKIT